MEFNNINDFKNKFEQIYCKEVAPQLKYIDFERQTVDKKAILYSNITVPIGLIMVILGFIKAMPLIFFCGFIVCIIGSKIYSMMKKNFENKLKSYIMPMLMKAFGNFKWSQNRIIDTSEIHDSHIFPYFSTHLSDDNFSGTYRDMPIKISEVHLKHKDSDKNHTIFCGLLISIGVSKKFTGHTIVSKSLSNKPKGYDEVKLEDPIFRKKYYVYSTDQVEARFLLTPAFMERFKRMSTAFGATDTQCSFKEGKILLAISMQKGLFNLGELSSSVSNPLPYRTFMLELVSIFEMVDYLKILTKV